MADRGRWSEDGMGYEAGNKVRQIPIAGEISCGVELDDDLSTTLQRLSRSSIILSLNPQDCMSCKISAS